MLQLRDALRKMEAFNFNSVEGAQENLFGLHLGNTILDNMLNV